MKRIEKDLRKKISSCNLQAYEPRESLFNDIAKKIGINESKPFIRVVPFMVPTFVCVLLMLVIVTFGISQPNPYTSLVTPYHAIVQIDYNPSIQMVVDETSTVVSISGLNDDGKLVIINEELVGKKVSDVVDTIINVENKLGYFNEDADKALTVKVTSEDKKNLNLVKDEFTNAIEDALYDEDVDIDVEHIKGYTLDELRGFVLKYDPILTESVVEDFTFEQLVNVIKTYHLEIINFATVELEELYLDFKGMQVQLLEQSLHLDKINKLSVNYEELKVEFNIAYETLIDVYETFQVEYYNQYLDPSSDYRLTIDKLTFAKEAYLKQLNYVNNLPATTGEYERYVENKKLSDLEYEYLLCQFALKDIRKVKEATYNSIMKNFTNSVEILNKIFATAPLDTINVLSAIIENDEKKSELNSAILLKFGETYSVTISITYEKTNDKKNEIIDSNK